MIPTLFGITIIVFIIINLAPGGPIEQKIQQLQAMSESAMGMSNGRQTVSAEVVEALKKQYGFDKPLLVRYWIWLKNLSRLDFGESFTYEEPVMQLIVSKFPVSIQFGVISFILTYLICIPLGVAKAVKKSTPFDFVSTFVLFVMYSIPPLMLAILLIVFLAGGSFLDLFPLGGLTSDNYTDLTFFSKIWDRVHHFVLPTVSYMIGSFTTLTILMKNSLLDELQKDYVRTAKAKGLDDKAVYLKHALRNALIPIATGIGGVFSIFFAGSMLIEKIFQLDGIGLLSYNSILSRDYNVIMGLVFVESLVMLIGNLTSDLLYVVINPRIDFT